MWTSEETIILIDSIQSQLKYEDGVAYRHRLKDLKWRKIKVPFRSTQECKKRLDVVVRKTPKTRNLMELMSVARLNNENKCSTRKRSYSAISASYLKTISTALEPESNIETDMADLDGVSNETTTGLVVELGNSSAQILLSLLMVY